jgi:type IV secretory pathway TrbL component
MKTMAKIAVGIFVALDFLFWVAICVAFGFQMMVLLMFTWLTVSVGYVLILMRTWR